jgi:cobalt-zinc-cadmium resistance protein CzcA
MLNKIVQKSLENRLWILGFFAALSMMGLAMIKNLPIEAVPDITNVQVMINTQTGALDPERIEKTITYVIETEMAGLPGLEDIRSLSKYGLSQVVLVFKDGTDLYFIRQQVSQRLQNLSSDLPAGITPELAPITTGLGEVVMYTVDAKPGTPLAEKPEAQQLLYLRTIQDFVIRPELKKIPGVAEIDSSGGYRKEIHVNADTRAMDKHGVTFDDLFGKLRTLGDSYGGGYIQSDRKQIIVRTSSHLPDLKSLELIPVKVNFRGQPVLLKDVAGVREDHTQRLGAATSNGKEAVLGTALMYIGANSREVSLDVVEGIKNLPLPEDVAVNVVYTRSFLVNQTIKTVAKNLAEGAALVIVILLLLLGNFRAALAVALAIPVSMLFAIIGMRLFGISANLMSLGAIDFGLLVDGSVVMIENLLRHLEEQKGELTWKQKLDAVFESAKEVVKPVSLGLVIIMIVYVPILTLQGIEGKMFHPMAVTVLMALGASLAVAALLMPVLGYILIRPSKRGHESSATFSFIERKYEPILNWSVGHRSILLPVTLAFAAVCAALFFRLGSDFIPQLDEGDLVAGLVRPTNIALDESISEQRKAEAIIREFPEVERVFSRMGTPESATDPMGVNFADTFIILKKDRSAWPEVDLDGHKRRRTKGELMEAIGGRIEKELPGHEISPTQPIAMRFNEILEGSRADVAMRIFGPDLDKLIEYLDKSKEIIEKIPGAAEAETDALTALRKTPVMNINLDYGAMAKIGVSLEEANSTLMMAMGGIQVGNFYEYDRRFPVVLHLAEELRDKPEEISRIPLSLPDGGSVPLNTIAKFDESEQVTTIARSFGKRYSALAIFLQDRDVSSFVAEAKERLQKEVKLDPGYTIEWGGQFKNLERARLQLMFIIPLTLIAIFLLLLRDIGSLRLTLLVYACIPFALTGGVLALVLRGIPFSISAAVGFIALLGIAILNGMVLVDFINKLRASGRPVREAVMTGARTRLRPVVMTALVAGLGFVPMAFNSGLGAEVQRPLATVVIGGILTSTVLTLLLLPTLYIWFEEKP